MTDKKIKTIAQYKEDFVPEGLSSDKVLENRYLYSRTKYAGNGSVIEDERFDAQGNPEEKEVRSYDEEGRLKESKSILHGEVAEHKSYEYEDGKLKREYVHYMVVMEYDEQGNNILQEERMEDGTVVSTISRAFDAEGLHISSEVFLNGMGQQMSQRYNVYREYEFFN